MENCLNYLNQYGNLLKYFIASTFKKALHSLVCAQLLGGTSGPSFSIQRH